MVNDCAGLDHQKIWRMIWVKIESFVSNFFASLMKSDLAKSCFERAIEYVRKRKKKKKTRGTDIRWTVNLKLGRKLIINAY